MTAQTSWTDDQWRRVSYVMSNSDYDYLPKFKLWLYSNYPLWVAFVDKTREMSRFKKRPRFGAKAIIEIIRWDTMVHERDITFKVNNNHAPDLARLIMARFPEFDGFFSIRGSVNRQDAAV